MLAYVKKHAENINFFYTCAETAVGLMVMTLGLSNQTAYPNPNGDNSAGLSVNQQLAYSAAGAYLLGSGLKGFAYIAIDACTRPFQAAQAAAAAQEPSRDDDADKPLIVSVADEHTPT